MDHSWSGNLVDFQPKPFQTTKNKLWGILVIQKLFALIIKRSLSACLVFIVFNMLLYVLAYLTGVLLFIDYHDGILLSLPLCLR